MYELDYTKIVKINNPNDVKVGETVMLDRDFNNKSKVKILFITIRNVYSSVMSSDGTGDAWTVMTSRLTKLTPEELS